MRSFASSSFVSFVVLLGFGCGEDGPTKKRIVDVDVDSGSRIVLVGGTAKITLNATLDDGTMEDLSLLATWTTALTDGSDASAFATVDGDGTVHGVAPGGYEVIANLNFGPDDPVYAMFGGNYVVGFETRVGGDAGAGDAGAGDGGAGDATTGDAGP